MVIDDQPLNPITAPSGSGMVLGQRVAVTVWVGFMAMPLLTELVSSGVAFCYRHCAPSGADFRRAALIAPNKGETTSEC